MLRQIRANRERTGGPGSGDGEGMKRMGRREGKTQVFPESAHHLHPGVRQAGREGAPWNLEEPAGSNFFQKRGFLLAFGLKDNEKEVREGQRWSPPPKPR